jgi:indolepyruvate ferredoxin oxidoreductase
VFGIWYGKGPGVDRCSDVFKHANMAGTAKHGGVIAIAGDDHVAKSSTAAHQSDHIFKACGLPVFFPSSVQDILDMGLHAFAMSRFSGVWTGMKTIQEVVESSSSVQVDPDRVKIILPEDFADAARRPAHPLARRAAGAGSAPVRLQVVRGAGLRARQQAQPQRHRGPNDRFGIIASGKAYNDTRQALVDLGLDDDTCRRLGIRLHKVNVVWPLEATITRDFAAGPAGDPGRRGKAPGHRVPAQGRALQLARRRAPQRAGQVRRARRRHLRRRMEPCPTRARTGCCAPRPT